MALEEMINDPAATAEFFGEVQMKLEECEMVLQEYSNLSGLPLEYLENLRNVIVGVQQDKADFETETPATAPEASPAGAPQVV